MTNTSKSKGNIYSKIVGFFLFLTIVAIFVILHFALAKATIIIKDQTKTKQGTVLVEMHAEGGSEPSTDTLIGKIISTEMELEASVSSSQEAVPSDKAGGYVTIYNNYSQKQILINTTRLLTPDNKLFRITQRVEIPAGEQIEVWAEADQAGEAMIIGPTTFIIPGLWEGLQDKIYAETKTGMDLQSVPQYTVTQENLNQAHQQIVAQAAQQALETINQLLPESLAIGPERLYFDFATVASSKVGESSEQASVTEKVKAHGLIFAADDLYNIAKQKFAREIDSDESLLQFDPPTNNYDVAEIDLEKEQAVLEVTLSATISANADVLGINKDSLVGMDEAGIREYLKQLKIEDVQIKFFPAWIKKAPNIKDHIIIK